MKMIKIIILLLLITEKALKIHFHYHFEIKKFKKPKKKILMLKKKYHKLNSKIKPIKLKSRICGIDENNNFKGPFKCDEDYECNGDRFCYFFCQGISNC